MLASAMRRSEKWTGLGLDHFFEKPWIKMRRMCPGPRSGLISDQSFVRAGKRIVIEQRWYPSTALDDRLESKKARSTTRACIAVWIASCRIRPNWATPQRSVWSVVGAEFDLLLGSLRAVTSMQFKRPRRSRDSRSDCANLDQLLANNCCRATHQSGGRTWDRCQVAVCLPVSPR